MRGLFYVVAGAVVVVGCGARQATSPRPEAPSAGQTAEPPPAERLRALILATHCPEPSPSQDARDRDWARAKQRLQALLDGNPHAPDRIEELRALMLRLAPDDADLALSVLVDHFRPGVGERPFVREHAELMGPDGIRVRRLERSTVRALVTATEQDIALLPLLVDLLRFQPAWWNATGGDGQGLSGVPELWPLAFRALDGEDGYDAMVALAGWLPDPAPVVLEAFGSSAGALKALHWAHGRQIPTELLPVYVAMLSDSRSGNDEIPSETPAQVALRWLAIHGDMHDAIIDLQIAAGDPLHQPQVEAWQEWARSCEIEPLDLSEI